MSQMTYAAGKFNAFLDFMILSTSEALQFSEEHAKSHQTMLHLKDYLKELQSLRPWIF